MHCRGVRSCVLAIALGVLTLAGDGLAEPRDPVAADALFREARTLLKEQKYAEACPKLDESHRLDPRPGTLFNLAECEEKLGKLATALLRWQALIDMLTATSKLTDPRFSVARSKIENLSARVPRLLLRLKPGAPAGTVILRDGIELRQASLGVALPTELGDHTLLVRAPYRRDVELKISLKEGETRELDLDVGEPNGPGPQPSAQPADSAPPVASSAPSAPLPPPVASPPVTSGPRPLPAPASGRRTAGFIAGGVGVAALLGAGVTGLVLQGYKKTVDDNCNRDARRCNPEGLDAASAGETLAPVNLALWLVGAVGVGAGTYLLLSSPDRAVRPGLSYQPGQSSLWLHGRF